jgi:large subunit ribosomal protein L25
MEKLKIDVSKRDVTGKKVRVIRRQGKTPASLYGHGIDSMALQADAKQLRQILFRAGETDLILLNVAGAKAPVNVLVREVQRQPITGEVLHVDFYQVDMSQKIKANVPLTFIGEAPVLRQKNTSILHLIDSLHIEALPDHIPHKLEVDLSKLETLESAIHVKDVVLNPDITLLSDPDQIVAKAVEAKKEAVVEAPKAEAAAEAAAGEEKAEAGKEAAAPEAKK